VLPALGLPFPDLLPTVFSTQGHGSTSPVGFHYFRRALLLKGDDASPSSCTGHFKFKRLDRVFIFLTYILFYIFAENNNWVVVLLHSALRTLDGRLEPFDDAFCMKIVLALELLTLRFLDFFKTHCTCVRKVCTTLPLLDCLLLAFRSRECHR